jgi:hypothetical protein
MANVTSVRVFFSLKYQLDEAVAMTEPHKMSSVNFRTCKISRVACKLTRIFILIIIKKLNV